MNVVIIVHL